MLLLHPQCCLRSRLSSAPAACSAACGPSLALLLLPAVLPVVLAWLCCCSLQCCLRSWLGCATAACSAAPGLDSAQSLRALTSIIEPAPPACPLCRLLSCDTSLLTAASSFHSYLWLGPLLQPVVLSAHGCPQHVVRLVRLLEHARAKRVCSSACARLRVDAPRDAAICWAGILW